MTVEFLIDYFRITVHLPLNECIRLYDECFQIALGDLADLEHGAKGFKGVMGALAGFQLKHTPGNRREYCTFEFPGKACGSVAPEQFIERWGEVAISHLRDFVDVDRPWWKEFICDTDRAYKRLRYAKDVTLEKSSKWLLNQVAPALSAVSACTDGNILLEMDREGRKRMGKRYGPLLSAFGKGPNNVR